MAEFLTLKKSNCKNCYKCIRHCPVKAIRFSGNQAHIIGNACILCGQCFVICPQNAKEIKKAKVIIQSGAPVVASIAPSFIANYEGCGIESLHRPLRVENGRGGILCGQRGCRPDLRGADWLAENGKQPIGAVPDFSRQQVVF